MANRMTVLGAYDLDERGARIPKYVDIQAPGDYGCDPMPGGMFKMVPSGEIVDAVERAKRLARFH